MEGDALNPAVSAVVVTYQSRPFIEPCLTSIAKHAGLPIEVVVVDNGSTDGTLEHIRAARAESRVMALESNRGFAAAANLGAAAAQGDYLLFLNPDAELRAGAVPALVAHLQTYPAVAAAGPRLSYPNGARQEAAFTYPSLVMTWLEFFPHPGRLLRTRVNGRLSSPDGQPIPIDHPLGACMLVRRSAWIDVGPFDEGFFLYCEEVDWCMRAKRRGWEIHHVPAAEVMHYGGASAATAPAESLAHLYQSRMRLHRKHRGRWFQLAAAFITRLGLAQERRRLMRRARTSRLLPHEAARAAAIDRALQRVRG